MSASLNPEVRARLDAHLDAVEKALAEAKSTRERRRGIVDDLEAQILEMLEKRSATPTVADLEGVLAGLDPPAAYGEAATPRQAPAAAGARAGLAPGESPFGANGPFGTANPFGPPKPRLSRMAVAGLLCILGSMFFSALALGFFLWGATRVVHSAQPAIMDTAGMKPMLGIWAFACVGVLPSVLAVLGTLLGWLAFARIRASGGKLHGRGLALFDGLLFPVLFGLLLFIIFPLPMILLLFVAGGITVVVLLMRFIPARA